MEISEVIAVALASGAAAGAAEQAVAEAYEALKGVIKSRYSKVNLDLIEEQPSSKNRRRVVAEDLENEGAETDDELIIMSKELIEMIQAEAPETFEIVGVDLEIEADVLNIEDVSASAGTGVKVRGEFDEVNIRGVRTLEGSDKDPKVQPE